jgi:hypothetical protein
MPMDSESLGLRALSTVQNFNELENTTSWKPDVFLFSGEERETPPVGSFRKS